MSSQVAMLEALENWAGVYLFRSITAYFDYLKSSGVSLQQAYALTFIHYKGPSKISAICEHMTVSAAAVSQMVNRLEKQNLVQRIADPEDRRVRNVMLTDAGESFVQQSIKARQGWIREIPVELDDEQMDQVSAALQLLITLYQEEKNK